MKRLTPAEYPDHWIKENTTVVIQGKNITVGETRNLTLIPQYSLAKKGTKAWFERTDPYWQSASYQGALGKNGHRSPGLTWKEENSKTPITNAQLKALANRPITVQIVTALQDWSHLNRGQVHVLVGRSREAVDTALPELLRHQIIRRGTRQRPGYGRIDYVWSTRKGKELARFLYHARRIHGLDKHYTSKQPGNNIALHNVLAGELACRLIENTDKTKTTHIGVANQANIKNYYNVSHETSKLPQADFFAIIHGRLIAFEIERSVKPHEYMLNKTRQWAALLYTNPEIDITVIFVGASLEDPTTIQTRLVNAIKEGTSIKELSYATDLEKNRIDPKRQATVQKRILHVAWEDWFPGNHLMDKTFPGLIVSDQNGKQQPLKTHLDGLPNDPCNTQTMIPVLHRNNITKDTPKRRIELAERRWPTTPSPLETTSEITVDPDVIIPGKKEPTTTEIQLPEDQTEARKLLEQVVLTTRKTQHTPQLIWPDTEWTPKAQAWLTKQLENIS